MKKIFLFSDTHRNLSLIQRSIGIMSECDAVIHLGDYVSDTAALKDVLGDKLICVRGNGDVFSLNCPDEREIEFDGVKIFLTHGHKYNVKKTLHNIATEALKRECQAAFYGHTHIADITQYGGVSLINPGSFYASRSGVYSYCYIIIWKGKIIPKIVEL
jgi:putative phosphoesterase